MVFRDRLQAGFKGDVQQPCSSQHLRRPDGVYSMGLRLIWKLGCPGLSVRVLLNTNRQMVPMSETRQDGTVSFGEFLNAAVADEQGAEG